jgi:hypothetical protein
MSDQFVLCYGRRYRAAISLGMLQSLATNEMIASRLQAFGFTEVIVSGQGGRRTVEVLWLKADVQANMPKEITSVEEMSPTALVDETASEAAEQQTGDLVIHSPLPVAEASQQQDRDERHRIARDAHDEPRPFAIPRATSAHPARRLRVTRKQKRGVLIGGGVATLGLALIVLFALKGSSAEGQRSNRN